MRKQITVSVGIPAYNEELNIKGLIDDITRQTEKSFRLERIIVSSDGSTDGTVSILKKLEDTRIIILDNKTREGVAVRQNQILKSTSSDVVILLNADIGIKDLNFIEHLITPIIVDDADLVTPDFIPVKATTFFEHVLHISMEFKKSIYKTFHRGNNLYSCQGPARAFSKSLYTKLYFKPVVGEDAYSYLYAVKNGYKYCHTSKTAVYFKLPDNFTDHEKQSRRFMKSVQEMELCFGQDFVKKEYKLPSGQVIPALWKYFLKYPVEISYYLGIWLFITATDRLKKPVSVLWDVSSSSKRLHNI